jgi:transcriptional regulator with XRE-family HTH domain
VDGGEEIAFEFPAGLVYVLYTMNGQELRKAREALHMTQKELAEALDLAKNHVALMERDEATIRRVTEFAVKHLLTVSKKKGRSKATK